MNDDRDWYGALGTALLEEADATPPIDLDSFDVDEFVADVMAGRFDVPAGALVSRRRRWKRYGAIGAIIAVTAGGAVAATQLGNEKVRAPRAYEGVDCLSDPYTFPSGTAIALSDDPLGDCRELWLLGAMANDGLGGGPPMDVAPELFACVSTTGIIEVVPRPIQSDLSCADLGLDEADLTDLTNNPYLKLQSGLSAIDERCLPEVEAKQEATDLLDDLDLNGWTFVLADPTAVPTSADICAQLTMLVDSKAISVRMVEPR